MAASEKTRQTNLKIGGATRLAVLGRLHPVTTGCYLAPELNGGNSASNLKASLRT
jgi:hypothetical protein